MVHLFVQRVTGAPQSPKDPARGIHTGCGQVLPLTSDAGSIWYDDITCPACLARLHHLNNELEAAGQ